MPSTEDRRGRMRDRLFTSSRNIAIAYIGHNIVEITSKVHGQGGAHLQLRLRGFFFSHFAFCIFSTIRRPFPYSRHGAKSCTRYVGSTENRLVCDNFYYSLRRVWTIVLGIIIIVRLRDATRTNTLRGRRCWRRITEEIELELKRVIINNTPPISERFAWPGARM